MSIGARFVSIELVLKMLDIWLATPFDGGRHDRRIRKIAALEAQATGCEEKQARV